MTQLDPDAGRRRSAQEQEERAARAVLQQLAEARRREAEQAPQGPRRSGVPRGTPESEPAHVDRDAERVTGKDGKSYPATRTRKPTPPDQED
jgi:hypothetical protein